MQRERSAIGCRYENGGKKMSSEWLSSWVNTRISVLMPVFSRWRSEISVNFLSIIFIGQLLREILFVSGWRVESREKMKGSRSSLQCLNGLTNRYGMSLYGSVHQARWWFVWQRNKKGIWWAFCAPETGISFFDLYRIGKRQCSAFALESDRFSERRSPVFCERNEMDMWSLRRKRWELSW